MDNGFRCVHLKLPAYRSRRAILQNVAVGLSRNACSLGQDPYASTTLTSTLFCPYNMLVYDVKCQFLFINEHGVANGVKAGYFEL